MNADDSDIQQALQALARHLADRRGALLVTWRAAVRSDPALSSSKALSREDMNDHVPALLSDFEQALSRPTPSERGAVDTSAATAAIASDAEAHGLHRWQQGYDLREVARELGQLNECMCVELDAYAAAHPQQPLAVMAEARLRWARACTVAQGESSGRFHRQQQVEAAGHIEELEAALDDLTELEGLRAELWQQAAHDLRGNVAVVANATVGLARDPITPTVRDRFLLLLQRNVTGLNHLLNDVTSLARLQAGEEHRQVASFDVSHLLNELCSGMAGMAEHRGLYMRFKGPSALQVEGDAVKVRRIVQNLILNALSYTQAGGVEASWGDAPAGDERRWQFTLSDTGPGLPAAAGADNRSGTLANGAPHGGAGEGLGLSIMKRLCDLLDAAVEIESRDGEGTRFRILFPRAYEA